MLSRAVVIRSSSENAFIQLNYSSKCLFFCFTRRLAFLLHCKLLTQILIVQKNNYSASSCSDRCKQIKVCSAMHFVFPSFGNFIMLFAVSATLIIGAVWDTYIGPPTKLDICSSNRSFDFLVFFLFFCENFTNLSNLFTKLRRLY